jgi:hypothetical protein
LGVEDGVEQNECFVAPEVIKEGEFSVAVFAEDLITTNKISIKVKPSGYTENIVNQTKTPSVAE